MEAVKRYQTVIEPGKLNRNFFRELWLYRELFYFLSWRDILVRYRQTAIGMLWGVLRPLLIMIVFTIVFGKIARLPSGGLPYPVLVFSGMLPWQLFSTSFSESSNSLIGNVNLISKVYFPRIVIPVSSIIVNFVDFFISMALLAVLMAYYRIYPDWRALFLPVVLLGVFLLSVGLGLWFSALNVRFRDFRYVIPFIVQFGLYITPVGFSSAIIPEKWRLAYFLNPMTGIVDCFRWSLLGGRTELWWPGVAIAVVLILIILWTGFLWFRKTELTFADVI